MESFGYIGMAILILVENIFPPIPSELILTFGGFMDNLYEYECRWGNYSGDHWLCYRSNYALLYWSIASKRAIGADCKWKDRKSPAFKTG